jgi:hypothetical protein
LSRGTLSCFVQNAEEKSDRVLVVSVQKQRDCVSNLGAPADLNITGLKYYYSVRNNTSSGALGTPAQRQTMHVCKFQNLSRFYVYESRPGGKKRAGRCSVGRTEPSPGPHPLLGFGVSVACPAAACLSRTCLSFGSVCVCVCVTGSPFLPRSWFDDLLNRVNRRKPIGND